MNSQDALLDDIHKSLLGRNSSLGKDAASAKRILLTGGAGFIGSVLAKKLVFNYPDYFVLVIDKLDYCSSLNNLRPLLPLDEYLVPPVVTAPTTTTGIPTAVADQTSIACSLAKPYPNFKFIHGDITDLDVVQNAMIEYKIDTVIHLAAQTHVDKSFGESIEFTKNNVLGAHVVLEAARKLFCPPNNLDTCVQATKAGDVQLHCDTERNESGSIKRFIYVSTDEVYGEVMLGQPDCKEQAPLAPSNPYSATKAAAECMVQAYHKSFHLPIIITRSNNVYGPFQYPEKIFPKFIMSLLNNSHNNSNSNLININYLGIENSLHYQRNTLKPGSSRRGIKSGGYCYIHGSGQHSRTYLYVTDVANALDVILHRGEVGHVYNIGGGHEMSNLELAQDLIHRMGQMPKHQSNDTNAPVKPVAVRNGNGVAPKTQLHGPGHELDQQLPQRSLDDSRDRDSFTKARQEAAEQHLSRCKDCADRIVFVEDRAFNDQRYAVDATKLFNLGWSPMVSFEEGIRNTIEWYKQHGKSWWGDIHRALYPHSIRMSEDESAATSAAPSQVPSRSVSPLPASSRSSPLSAAQNASDDGSH
ncbi:hypothetical protein B0O80DRAFT_240850 [Mortierella sp. GBAus27b]|nr:hypothetical protein B0O80DRAFT_240850 [Mortierella sp. GBAus27b]